MSNLRKSKALSEQYLRDVMQDIEINLYMTQYSEIRDDRNYMSMLEDFSKLPSREGVEEQILQLYQGTKPSEIARHRVF